MAAPDRQRWGNPNSYKPGWARRAELAATLVRDGARVLEVGVGTGAFRDLVRDRTEYMGVDLEPLDDATLALDLDRDPLPALTFDCAVLLGVFGYLHQPESSARKLCDAANCVIVSYCCRRTDVEQDVALKARIGRGWANHYDRAQLVELFCRQGHRLVMTTPLNTTDDFEQCIMTFQRQERQDGSAPA
ncbi:MAG TPA: methyltransferase domain-containing protein [Albitalea sp.]|nr:methyltransferase domain-containing protein [Albitalea sp.]